MGRVDVKLDAGKVLESGSVEGDLRHLSEMLAVFVLIGSFLAYLLYMQGVKNVGSMRAGLIGTVEPVSATVTSAILLGTAFAPTDIVGFVLIIAMMFLTV